MKANDVSLGTKLIVAGVFIALIGLWITWLALQNPATGLTFQTNKKLVEIIVSSKASALIPTGKLRAISIPTDPSGIQFNAMDLIEEPHALLSYAEMNTFFERQQQLHHILKSPTVVLTVESSDGKLNQYTIHPIARTLADLPFVFWFQLAVSSLGFLLGCWIWVLRPHDIGARMFGLMNCMYPVFAFSAAIYSTRDIALEADLFRTLMLINNAGAYLFGCALMALFLSYPKPLVQLRFLILILVIFVPWYISDMLQLLPDPSLGADLPITLQMLLAIFFAVWQWFANRTDPLARAALRWFAVSVLTSCGLFVFFVQSSELMGIQLGLSQGYAFGFFLLMNVGIALGLRRYRLFDLDEWAFKILYWMAAALALVALDTVLIFQVSPAMSFGLALLTCGLLWLPARGWIQRRIMPQRKMKESDLFKSIIEVSFATSEQERAQRWQNLVQQLFDPLKIHEPAESDITDVTVAQQRLSLHLPATTSVPALQLDYPWQGRKLFSSRDVRLSSQLVALMRQADQGRLEYDRGVAEERGRIARDLHDDIGSRLLSGLHHLDIDQTRHTIRQSIAEIRTMVSGLSGGKLELAVIMLEIRHETDQRLHAAGITLEWPLEAVDPTIVLAYPIYKNYISIIRELMSNIIKHAHATQVDVEVQCVQGRLMTTMTDNGTGIRSEAAKTAHSGHGLPNLYRRIEVIQGHISVQSTPHGMRVQFDIPLQLEKRFNA
jgi:signal transduction histidine kinase